MGVDPRLVCCARAHAIKGTLAQCVARRTVPGGQWSNKSGTRSTHFRASVPYPLFLSEEASPRQEENRSEANSPRQSEWSAAAITPQVLGRNAGAACRGVKIMALPRLLCTPAQLIKCCNFYGNVARVHRRVSFSARWITATDNCFAEHKLVNAQRVLCLNLFSIHQGVSFLTRSSPKSHLAF
jgi:hypothetical protein